MVPEVALYMVKAITKDPDTTIWGCQFPYCLRTGALMLTTLFSLKGATEVGVVEDLNLNRSQSERTGIGATEDEVTISRHKANIKRLEGSVKNKTSFHMVMSHFNTPKGSFILREEEANRIKEEGRFVEEIRARCY